MARILHVIPYMHPRAGGPPVVVENLVRETGKYGHESQIISTPLFCSGDEKALLQRLNGLAPTSFLTSSPFILFDHNAKHEITGAVRSADIVHIHTLWNPINTLVRWACTSQKRPYVLMPHGMLDPYALSVKRWRKALYLWALERQNIASAIRLIYTTPEEARLAATQMSLPHGVVVPLGADAPDGNSDELASQFLERFPQARGRRPLLFLGRLHIKKGLDRILTALPAVARTFPDVLLTVVGDGSSKYQRELCRTIVAENLDSNVLMTGRLEGTLKWGAYACAELFLLPSRQENFAITVAEAMQMGVPLIISNKVNTWPYVNEAGAGLILDENGIEAGLEGSIISLMKDTGRRKVMGTHGREYARRILTWAQSTTSLMKCYDEVLANARMGGSNL
jgi:glycosyltransferase involved in cell wall biosynthesis